MTEVLAFGAEVPICSLKLSVKKIKLSVRDLVVTSLTSSELSGSPGVLSKELNCPGAISKQADNGGLGWCVSPPSSPPPSAPPARSSHKVIPGAARSTCKINRPLSDLNLGKYSDNRSPCAFILGVC